MDNKRTTLKIWMFLYIIITIINIISIFVKTNDVWIFKIDVSSLYITSMILYAYVYEKNGNTFASFGILSIFAVTIISIVSAFTDPGTFLLSINNILITFIGFCDCVTLLSLIENYDNKYELIKKGTIFGYILAIVVIVIMIIVSASIKSSLSSAASATNLLNSLQTTTKATSILLKIKIVLNFVCPCLKYTFIILYLVNKGFDEKTEEDNKIERIMESNNSNELLKSLVEEAHNQQNNNVIEQVAVPVNNQNIVSNNVESLDVSTPNVVPVVNQNNNFVPAAPVNNNQVVETPEEINPESIQLPVDPFNNQ